MGEVYLAHDSTLERPVAIKLITGFRTDQEMGRRRLLREAQAAAALDHPNICAVHEVRSEGDRSFIVMQFCDGETLAARLERGPLGADDTADVLGQVADALAFAHRAGLVHRDIKPHNIMVSPHGRVKFLDFSLVKVAGLAGPSDNTPTETVLTFQGSPVGTASYMAPEQIRCEPVDARADLFALGVVMYECLTGRRPFEGRSTYEILDAVVTREPPPPHEVNPAVPAAFSDLCLHLLAKRPEDRLQSAAELRDELAALGRGAAATTARSATAHQRTASAAARQPPRRRYWLPLAAGLAVAAVAAAAWLLLGRSTPLAEPSAQARRWHEAGVHALRGGAYQDAVRALRQAVQVDDRYVMAWARLAEAQAELDDMRSAPQSLNRMWQLVPDRSRLPAAERLQLEAIAAMVTRRGHDAVQAYQKLAALASSAPHVLVDLGRAWEIVPDYGRAEEAYTQALAKDPQSAVAHLRRAVLRGQRGDHAAALADFGQAERLYGAASDLEGQSELLLQRGELRLDLQELAQAGTDARRADEIATAATLDHQRVRAALLLARVAVHEGKIGDAERYAREAVERSAPFESLQTQALVDYGNVFLAQSRYTEAEARFREAVAVGARFGAERATARARMALASVLVSVADGRVAEGQALAQAAYAYYDRNNLIAPKRQALQILVRAADTRGDLDAADHAARELLAMGTAAADRVTIAAAADALGTSLARRGRLPHALEQTERALQLYDEQGSELSATYTRLRRAELLVRLGRLADARDQLRELAAAGAAARELGVAVSPYLEGVQATLALNEGRAADAARAACQDRRQVDDRIWRVDMLLVCAAARARQGDRAGARRASDAALALARPLDDRVTLAQALAASAAIAEASRQPDDALARGREALGVYEPLQADEPAWRLHAVLSRAAGAAGRSDEAQQSAEAARAAFERLRQGWPPDALVSYLTTDAARAAGGPPRERAAATAPGNL